MQQGGLPPWDEQAVTALVHRLREEKSPLGLVFLDSQGLVTGWSEAAKSITGYSAEEVMGTSLALLFTPEDVARQLPEHELETARALGTAQDERWHLRKDGSRFWASGVTLALGDEGQLSAFVKVFRDATPLRFRLDWLENELDEVNAQQRDRDAFLATVAHELRNPLQPIAMAIKLLTHPSDKSRHEHALKVLDRQLSFMQHLIEDLVDMTRVKHAKMAIEYELVELQQLVRDAVESCRESAERNGLILDCVLPPVPVLIEVDPARITQVLVNLLNNAIKFTPRGGKVAVWATVDDGQLIVKVQDTGQGIAPDLQPKIFQMFTQANRATTGRGKGLGIGLALVKELVSLHQGSVELRSEGVGKGSEFFIRLPIAAPKGRR